MNEQHETGKAARWQANFCPRDYAQYPKLFGRNESMPFTTTANDPVELGYCEAARIQHLFAWGVNIRSSKMTRKNLADRTGIEYTRLSKLLNGHIPIKTWEMGRIARVLRLRLVWERDEQPAKN